MIKQISINGNMLDLNNITDCLRITSNSSDFIRLESTTMEHNVLGSSSVATFPEDFMRIMFKDKNGIDLLGIQYCRDSSGLFGQMLFNTGTMWTGISIKKNTNEVTQLHGITPLSGSNDDAIPTCQWVRNLLRSLGLNA